MSVRGTLAALGIASLLALPTLASSAIVQKWQTPPGVNYVLISEAGDLDATGGFELITADFGSGGSIKVAVLAQSVGSYEPVDVWLANIDADDAAEIIFKDGLTGNLVCLAYTAGQSTLAVRWSYLPTPNGVPSKWEFVNFDGNGFLYFVFKDESPSSKKFYIRDFNGVLQTTLDLTTAPGSGWTSDLSVDDYVSNGDARQELLIKYVNPTQNDVLYVFGSNAPGPQAATVPGVSESRATASPLRFAPRKLQLAHANSDRRAELDTHDAQRFVRLP